VVYFLLATIAAWQGVVIIY